MRSPQAVLETLRKHAQETQYQYERLYRNLYNPQFYLLAYQNLYANKGSMTPGADGKTISGMGMKRIEDLVKKIRDRSYQPGQETVHSQEKRKRITAAGHTISG